MADDHGLEIERRITVNGWKVEGGKRREFSSTSACYDMERNVASEEARIGEDLPDWHPHITSVVITERVVSPWRETYRTAEQDDGSSP